MTDYYWNTFSGTVHRQGCKFAHARHVKPYTEAQGKTAEQLVKEAEIERTLRLLNLCRQCFSLADRDTLRFYQATTVRKQLGD